MEQLEIGHEMAALCAEKAERTTSFSVEAAQAFVLRYLEIHGPTSAEDLTAEAVAAGHDPGEMRAFGAVYGGLSRRGLIRTVGFCARKFGHGTAGGRTWALVDL